jgi:hypothetical protein
VWARLALAAVLTALGSAAQAQDHPTLHSSSQKYAEKNLTGAKGRAGGATLAARLLYAKDGTTLLEATTGEFGSATPPPGTIWKMQVSALDALGVTMYTLTYNNLNNGGYFSQTYSNMYPGQPFQIQAHVRTGTKRNDVVALTASVQKRPDIAVTSINAPPRAPVNKPVKINAVISELNNNVGGRTDCVLYVNDVETDRANAVWVDSGDSVTCAFSPVFTLTGNNNIKVSALNVDPGDWDTGNNTAEQNILVSTLTPDWDGAFAAALVYDKNNTTFAQQGRYVNSTFTSGFDWVAEDMTDTDGDIWQYTGAAAAVPWQPTSVTANVSDGINSWSVQRAVSACDDFAIGQANGRTFYMSISGCGDLWIQAGGYSGTVTYTSFLITRTFKVTSGAAVYDAPAQYVYNKVNTVDVNGTNIFNGNFWTIDVQVTAGDFTFSKPLSFALDTPASDGATTPTTCTTGTSTDPAGFVRYCEASSWSKIARYGSATYIPQ